MTPAANDKQQIEPMVRVIEQQSGQRPASLLADSGYCSEKNLAYLAALGQLGYPIEAYIAIGQQKHDEYRQPCSRGNCAEATNGNAAIALTKARLSLDEPSNAPVRGREGAAHSIRPDSCPCCVAPSAAIACAAR